MKKIALIFTLAGFLTACLIPYEDDGLPRIRNQGDVDAYNATVSSPRQKLDCTRELVLGSNVREWVCMTVAQRERLAQDSQDALNSLPSGALGQ